MEQRNACILVGRLGSDPQERELPSGDRIVAFRVIVPRAGSTRVDTIDCVVEKSALRKRVLKLASGTAIEVSGALQRRFFRAGPSVASRYEVRVGQLTVCK